MFAKLLAELKRIAILLQSKKLVDKDYKPDEGGDDSKVNDFVVYKYNQPVLYTKILKYSFSDLFKVSAIGPGNHTAGEILTDEFINFINENKEEFLKYNEEYKAGSFFFEKINNNDYKIVETGGEWNYNFECWRTSENENTLSLHIQFKPISGNPADRIYLVADNVYDGDFDVLTKDTVLYDNT